MASENHPLVTVRLGCLKVCDNQRDFTRWRGEEGFLQDQNKTPECITEWTVNLRGKVFPSNDYFILFGRTFNTGVVC